MSEPTVLDVVEVAILLCHGHNGQYVILAALIEGFGLDPDANESANDLWVRACTAEGQGRSLTGLIHSLENRLPNLIAARDRLRAEEDARLAKVGM